MVSGGDIKLASAKKTMRLAAIILLLFGSSLIILSAYGQIAGQPLSTFNGEYISADLTPDRLVVNQWASVTFTANVYDQTSTFLSAPTFSWYVDGALIAQHSSWQTDTFIYTAQSMGEHHISVQIDAYTGDNMGYFHDSAYGDAYVTVNPNPTPVPTVTPIVTLTISTQGEGTTSPPPSTYTYTAGTQVIIDATPYYNQQFKYWLFNDGTQNTAATITLTLLSSKTVIAVFSSTITQPSPTPIPTPEPTQPPNPTATPQPTNNPSPTWSTNPTPTVHPTPNPTSPPIITGDHKLLIVALGVILDLFGAVCLWLSTKFR